MYTLLLEYGVQVEHFMKLHITIVSFHFRKHFSFVNY